MRVDILFILLNFQFRSSLVSSFYPIKSLRRPFLSTKYLASPQITPTTRGAKSPFKKLSRNGGVSRTSTGRQVFVRLPWQKRCDSSASPSSSLSNNSGGNNVIGGGRSITGGSNNVVSGGGRSITGGSNSVVSTKFNPTSFTSQTGLYAGRSAQFSSQDAKAIPLPDHVLPEAMVEWGDIPNSYEMLTGDDFAWEKSEGVVNFQRTELKVIPEVGCGADNLSFDKTVVAQNIPDSGNNAFSFPDGTTLLDTTRPPPISHPNTPHYSIETTFQVPDSSSRIRVSLNVLPRECEVVGEINVVKER